MKTPVLFMIFNRPEKSRQVFDAIARAKPEQLFVAADGPRTDYPDDVRLCREAREIIEGVDWDCEVRTFFREKNLSCKIAVSSAIDWFFEHVEEGIILEDDCLPADSFFTFCSELLERYRDDDRVMMISGTNFQDGIRRGEAGYYFTQIPHAWGWATWRRAWRLCDLQMEALPDWIRSGAAETVWPDQDVRNFWLSKLIPTYEGRVSAWDYRWVFSMLSCHAVSVCPAVNLVSNIGFGEDATNTSDANDPCANVPRGELPEIAHPSSTGVNEAADLYEYLRVFNVKYHSIAQPVLRWRKLLRKRWKIRRLLKQFQRRQSPPEGC